MNRVPELNPGYCPLPSRARARASEARLSRETAELQQQKYVDWYLITGLLVISRTIDQFSRTIALVSDGGSSRDVTGPATRGSETIGDYLKLNSTVQYTILFEDYINFTSFTTSLP
ncbi:hypothetical protein J6590_020296 [Homalodisca vitripennis]|nr:hypothetical protein J6590_020296 [Homalodisca vitripennis]